MNRDSKECLQGLPTEPTGDPPSMIIGCPNCGAKNRVSDPPRKDGTYRYGSCQSVIEVLQTRSLKSVQDQTTNDLSFFVENPKADAWVQKRLIPAVIVSILYLMLLWNNEPPDDPFSRFAHGVVAIVAIFIAGAGLTMLMFILFVDTLLVSRTFRKSFGEWGERVGKLPGCRIDRAERRRF